MWDADVQKAGRRACYMLMFAWADSVGRVLDVASSQGRLGIFRCKCLLVTRRLDRGGNYHQAVISESSF